MNRILQNTLAALTKPERRRLAVLAVADVIISIMDIVVLALLLLLVHAYTQPGPSLHIPRWIQQWFTGSGLLPALSVILLLFIIKNTAGYLAQKAKYNFVYNVAARISEINLLQYLEGNYHDYVSRDSSVHIRRISQQPVEFGHYVLAGFQQMFSEVVMILLTIIAIIFFDAKLFLLLCVLLAPALLLLSVYIKRRLSTVRSNIKTSSEQALQYLKEALSGYIESNVYGTKDFFTARYSNKQQTLNKYLAKLQSAQALPPRLMETFAIFGLLLLITLNELMHETTVIPIVTIGAFLAAAYKIIPGLVKILNMSGQVKTYAFTAEDMASQFAIPATDINARHGSIHSIELKNVFYNYNNKPVLEDVSLRAKRGEIIGLTGISGKGKTTLLNLLLGFLEPDKGEILINDHATSGAQRQLYWPNTSYVKQQPFVVHDSILTNITLSNEHNEQQLKHAVQASALDALIAQLPDGLQTIVTENGKNISGGQRQRIAFARALYKNADLLLLDEPFNELDEASEKNMLQQLQQLQQQGKIILLITHNKTSLSFCTRIISMDAA